MPGLKLPRGRAPTMSDETQNVLIAKCEQMVSRVVNNTSLYELFLFVLTRLHSRYDQQTLEFLRKHTNGDPLYAVKQGVMDRYSSAQQIREMLRCWRKGQDFLSKPFNKKVLHCY